MGRAGTTGGPVAWVDDVPVAVRRPSVHAAVPSALARFGLLTAKERDVLQLALHAHVLAQQRRADQRDQVGRPPLPARRETTMLPAEEEVQQVEGGGEVEALFRALDHYAQDARADDGVDDVGDAGNPTRRKCEPAGVVREDLTQRNRVPRRACQRGEDADPQPEVEVHQALHAQDLVDDQRRVEPGRVEHDGNGPRSRGARGARSNG
eukprot:CAMPEP_0180060552 /NCGR_PEP_ID=MMETSP0985-20121206/6120_1 /TAXON_ID=483367 /ORGANISM="non described non described, Strain CCMP 2436" /LENGTH=207 /DNA_ID=CAMNT_0021990617 /DNA_START=122 /DNA_END=746 /DNA_ORIENTATION=+